MGEELPQRVSEEVTRIARRVLEGDVSMDTIERIIAPHGYRARIREEDGDAVLVCYPDDWEGPDGIDYTRIEDTDRAIELNLYGDVERDWNGIARENTRVVERVRAVHGDVHAANVQAFADFMNNHRARLIAHARDEDVEEFLGEYYPRNVWPSEAEQSSVDASVELARSIAESLL